MKEIVKILKGKKVTCNYYSKKEIRELVSEIENSEFCISEAAEKYGVSSFSVKKWLQRYSKTITVKKVKPRLSEEIKKTIIRDIQAGLQTINGAATKLNVSPQAINTWLKKYSIQAVSQVKSIQDNSSKMDKTSLKEIEELKLKVMALETMIDVAEKELNIDIRKKSGTKRSL
jgi:transposase